MFTIAAKCYQANQLRLLGSLNDIIQGVYVIYEHSLLKLLKDTEQL